MFDSSAGCQRFDAQPVPTLTTVAEADHYISVLSGGNLAGSLRIKNLDTHPVLADLTVTSINAPALASSLTPARMT